MSNIIKEPFGKLPEDLVYIDVGSNIDFLTGPTFDSTKFNTEELGTRLSRGINITRGKMRWGKNNTQYWNDDISSLEKYQLTKNDLVIGMDGSLVGRNYALVTKEDLPCLLVQRVARLRNNNSLDIRYLYYAIASDYWLNYVDVVKTNSGIPHISNGDIKNFSIPKHSIKNQKKIAKILTNIDQLIKNTQELIDKHTSIKQGMMTDLFTRGIDLTTGQLRPSIEQAPHLYKETELGWVPRDWDIKTINDLAVRVGSGVTPTGGSEIYKSEGVMFLRSQNIIFDSLKLDDVAYIDDSIHESMISSEVFAYDVLINITGASIGRCCCLPNGLGPVNTNQHVCAIRFSKPKKEDSIYLSKVLASYIGQNQIYTLNAGGNREGLNYQQLRSFLIPWPKNSKEIDAITERLVSIDLKIDKNVDAVNKYTLLKKGLMQDLLTGKVAVS